MKLVASAHFRQNVEKCISKNPRYRKKIEKTLQVLIQDPGHPSLRIHKIKGNYYSISIDMSIRIIYSREGDTVYLLKLGSHEDVY